MDDIAVPIPSTLESLLRDSRWGFCGFPTFAHVTQAEDFVADASSLLHHLTSSGPIRDFHSSGLLALKSLTGFLWRYDTFN